MNKLKSRKLIVAAAIVVLLVCSALAVFAVQQLRQAENEPRIIELARLSGLDGDTVKQLYKAVGDWDKLLAGIMLYKELIALAEGEKADKLLYRLIPQYQAADLYTAFDYYTAGGLPLDNITEVLDRRAAGEEWDKILAESNITPQYKTYRVLGKEELHQLLVKGCLPEDIMEADEIARSKDLSLESVLDLKTDANTWDDVAGALGSRVREARRQPEMTVPGLDKAATGQGLDTLVAASSQKAGERKQSEKAQLKDEFALTDEEIEAYLTQGFNPWEVRNAYKLARANEVSPKEILDRKKAGQGWQDILAAYPEK